MCEQSRNLICSNYRNRKKVILFDFSFSKEADQIELSAKKKRARNLPGIFEKNVQMQQVPSCR